MPTSLRDYMDDVNKLIEEELNKFLSTGTDDTDPYWDLFKCKQAVNDALVEAVKYGFKEGMKRTRGVKDWAEDSATIRMLRQQLEEEKDKNLMQGIL